MATQDLINAYNTAKTADDAATQAVNDATTTKVHTTADVQAAASALSTDLQTNGPAVTISSDTPPVVTYYAFATGDPGFTAMVVRIA